MSAPVIVGIEQVPESTTQQVFVPCFVPVSHGFCFAPPDQYNDQGVWPSPYGYVDNTCNEWGYGMQQHRVPSAPVYQSHGPDVRKKAKPTSSGRSFAQPLGLDPAIWPRGSSMPSQASNGDRSSLQKGLTPETVTIVLGNLPKMLSTRSGLEVAFENQGFDNVVQCFEILNDKHEAVVGLCSEDGAQRFIRYFAGLKWASCKKPVTARYCAKARVHLEEQEQRSKSESRVGKSANNDEKAKGSPDLKDEEASESPDLVIDPDLIKGWSTKCANTKKDSYSAKDSSRNGFPEGKLQLSPNPRWADYDDDNYGDDLEDDYQSTFAGTVLDNCATSVGDESVNFDDF